MLRQKPLKLGTTYIIGSYILPGELYENINIVHKNKIKVHISNCTTIIEKVRNGELDLGLIETPSSAPEVVAQEWIENELIICSKTQLPPLVEKNSFSKYKLICHEDTSPIKKLINNFFESFGISYDDFHSISKIDNTTAAIQSVKWARRRHNHATITIVSTLAIEDEVKRKELFVSRIKNHNMNHHFYIVYHENTSIQNIEKIINILQEYKN
jgi:DNA-binding transcriptional LysR family regulator